MLDLQPYKLFWEFLFGSINCLLNMQFNMHVYLFLVNYARGSSNPTFGNCVVPLGSNCFFCKAIVHCGDLDITTYFFPSCRRLLRKVSTAIRVKLCRKSTDPMSAKHAMYNLAHALFCLCCIRQRSGIHMWTKGLQRQRKKIKKYNKHVRCAT